MYEIAKRIWLYLQQHNYSGQGLAQFISETGQDRRYKAKILAATSDYSSGILTYKGYKYYFSAIAPWTYCPEGEIEVEVM